MRENFEQCLAEVLRHEGGYVNHAADPGGETNFGISKRSYPTENIRAMTRERAGEIYRRDYWIPIKGDDLPAGMDLVAFDAAVNSGVSRGAKWLQAALGVAQDGKIGPATIAAARKSDAGMVINRACDARMAFLRSLGTWSTFGKGWTRRVDSVRSTALLMATPTRPAPKPAPAATQPMAGDTTDIHPAYAIGAFVVVLAAAAYFWGNAMIDTIQNILQPILADYLTWLVLGIVGFFLRHLPAKWRVEVEARHRDALHKAIDTGIGLVIDAIQKDPRIGVPDAAVTRVVGYVLGSVPDAIRRLGPSQDQLERMARAKLQKEIDAIMGRDRLTEALKDAGLPAVKP